ncbi:biotin synthase auxiliary protein BsaP [Rhodococcus sp. BP-335]|uniref:biotin synthase auxiliary protein BsaP n=1 Tax=Rhodococcus sp. BP-335 TaxID=2739450 RepID=UPI0021BF74EF|nr:MULTISPECIES: hypothetical protein [unclassified Rhodococcus (in: high G+C Gram-positive bacteria)]
MPPSESPAFDGWTGAPLADGARPRPRDLEPPRYCAWCGRRMVVQVFPSGWSAHCSRHPLIEG